MFATLLTQLLPGEPKPPLPAHVLGTANAIMDEIDRTGQKAGIIRLQRLAVLSQGWSIALTGRAMFDADIQVTVDTPSVVAIHSAFRRFGSGDIAGRAAFPEIPSFDYPSDQEPGRARIIEEVVKAYGRLSGYDLGVVLRRMMPDLVNGTTIPHAALRDAFLAAADRQRKD